MTRSASIAKQALDHGVKSKYVAFRLHGSNDVMSHYNVSCFIDRYSQSLQDQNKSERPLNEMQW